jgi:hypothetical protein
MVKLFNNKQSRVTKIHTIKSVLAGTYEPPTNHKTYFIVIADKVHYLEKSLSSDRLLIGDETQYQQWKKDNCNPGDLLFVCDYGHYPHSEYNPCKTSELKPLELPASDTPMAARKPLELPPIDNGGTFKNMEYKEEVYIDYEPITEPTNVVVTGGKISQYGDKWRLSDETKETLQKQKPWRMK